MLNQCHGAHAAPQSAVGEEGSAEQGFTSDLTDSPTWLVDPVVSVQHVSPGFRMHKYNKCLAMQPEILLGLTAACVA